MHAFDSTANPASRPTGSTISRASSRGGSADENTHTAVTAIKRKPSVPRLSLNSRAAPTRPTSTSTRITATVTAHTATYATRTTASIRRSSGSTTSSTRSTRPSPPPAPQQPLPLTLSQPPSRRRPQPPQPKDGNIPPPATLAVASRSPVLSTATRAMRLTAPSSSSTTKTPATAPTARQPQVPSLSRPATTRPPLTPKVAGTRPPSVIASSASASATAVAATTTPQQQQQPQKPRPQTATPLARRPTRSDSLTGNAAETPRGDVGTPVSTLLQHANITPRSGTRQHRVDSTSSTPTGTPQPESIESWDAGPSPGLGPTHSADTEGAPPRRPMVSFSSAPSDLAKVAAAPLSAPADSKFFYASSARPQSVSGAPQKLFQAPQQQQQKASSFYYANGASLPPKPNAPSAIAPAPFSPALGPPISTPGDAFSNKFVYANGVPDVLPSPRSAFSGSRPGSSMSATSKIAQGRGVSGSGPPAAPYGSSRPVSPLKQPFHPVPRPGVGTPNLPSKRLTPPAGSLPFTAPTGPAQGRRISNEYPLHVAGGGSNHKRNKSSATSVDNAAATFARVAPTPRMVPSRPPSLDMSSPTGLGFPAGFTGLLQAAEELSEGSEADDGDDVDDGDDDDVDDNESDVSDNSASKSKSPVDELVINARRERKVQDLQITNASLEAINRTLERQLRKQTAELRRYKRLSRAGRLSIATVNSGSASDATMEGPLRDPSALGLEDLSEEDLSGLADEVESPEEEEEMSDIEEEDGSGSSQLSPATAAERDTRHRKGDEKRLLVDLSKHQQLLVDSQKINQSIKRCMNWTEELIKEGQRALKYQVRISEVDINGNALRDEDEDEDEDDEGETMPAVVVDFGHGERGFADGESGKGSQDRDSGVELPSDGG
ncbi:hypothetical protein GGTG_10465 [Gaeumannomyces tritici R3-111a-1]|uniref:Uncharacterized protein n=1 Tax=Gaeumannomyces tritici (strain R3-111a-1) TaxID=644352 RepID=J3PAD9_GAET3|nr:hypothetical protein GGTG_10465 [Gaeumannomyces tritici R3-111a-1]EJT71205.1 hypothetical protein GGTG_10465 [Gaeumannomyces tritici R3-111a-1]